jgi:hypothetical protein
LKKQNKELQKTVDELKKRQDSQPIEDKKPAKRKR